MINLILLGYYLQVLTKLILIKTCVVLGLVCFAYEGLKTLKSILHARRYTVGIEHSPK